MKQSIPVCNSSNAGCRGFSLVEVVLALGLVSFCMLPLLGLLPMGLGTIRDSRNEAAAALALEQIAISIRGARSSEVAPTNYQAQGAYSSLGWTVAPGGGTVSNDFANISTSGIPTAIPTDAQLAARVQITPPASRISAGAALISVAWPVQAKWNAASGTWSNAQGSVSTWLIFLPEP